MRIAVSLMVVLIAAEVADARPRSEVAHDRPQGVASGGRSGSSGAACVDSIGGTARACGTYTLSMGMCVGTKAEKGGLLGVALAAGKVGACHKLSSGSWNECAGAAKEMGQRCRSSSTCKEHAAALATPSGRENNSSDRRSGGGERYGPGY